MSDVFQKEDERKLACLCKALSLKTPDKFLINTRQKLAEILIEQNKYPEAKTEIEKIINIREENQWKIPGKIKEWSKQSWYKSTEGLSNNNRLYKAHKSKAEELLFHDIPEEIVAVEFVNSNRNILNFVKERNKYGFFNFEGLMEKPQIGDILKVRFKENKEEGYFNVLTARKITEHTNCSAIKEFHGSVKIKENLQIGFVEDVFIDQKTISKYKIYQGQELKGKAILSYNKKRNNWGWKAIEITNKKG